MASWIISITVVVDEKWDEGPRVNHDKFNYISTAHKHQKRLHMGVRSVRVCGCEAQQNRINRLMRMRRISRGGCWTGSSCTWLPNHPFLPSSPAPLGPPLKKQNTRVPWGSQYLKTSLTDIWRGGLLYWPQWIRAVSFPPTWFISPPDTVFSWCPQDKIVTKSTECDGTTWLETNTFSVWF